MPPSSHELPVTIFEASSIELDGPAPGPDSFIAMEYGIETGEAERIAVDGVAKGDMGGGGNDGAGRCFTGITLTSVVSNLTTQRNASRMLYERAQVIRDHLNSAYLSVRRLSLRLITCRPSDSATTFQLGVSVARDGHYVLPAGDLDSQ